VRGRVLWFKVRSTGVEQPLCIGPQTGPPSDCPSHVQANGQRKWLWKGFYRWLVL